MDCQEIEENLTLIIEEIYQGLNALADTARANGTPDPVAERMEQFAWDICKHWPTCFAEHDPYVPPGKAQKA